MKTIVMLAVVGLAMALAGCASSDKDMACCATDCDTGMLRHVVLFQFKDSATPQQVDMIVEEFGKLPGKIDAIKGYEHGLINNVEKELQGGYTHAFTVTFADRAGLEAYLPHPAHKEFVDKVKPLLAKVHVADYVVK